MSTDRAPSEARRAAGAAVAATGELVTDGAGAGATFRDLAAEREQRGDEIVLLDILRPDEWKEVPRRAVHIPFYELEGRAAEVPADRVWVHLQSGHCASIGASLMDRAGRHVVHIDDREDAASAGSAMSRADPTSRRRSGRGSGSASRIGSRRRRLRSSAW